MLNFIISFLSQPAVLLGCVAFIGLVAQKDKDWTDVTKGTAKTVIGFLIFGIGSSTLTGVLQNFNVLFQSAFHIHGLIASPEAATAAAQTKYGFVVALILILGFAMNIVFARITPFKNIFFTGQHSLYFACVLGLVLKFSGLSNTWAIIIGGIILGLCASALPELCQPFMRKITGNDNQAIGHYNMFGYALSGAIGLLFKKHQDETTENFKLPKSLSIFKDFLMGLAIVMLILFYFSALVAGPVVTGKLAGPVDWLVYPFIQAMTFTAGMGVLMYGVGMFLEEITNAFVAISTKFIPGSRPALDVPTVFPFVPTAVLIGFVSSYAAGLVAIGIMVLLHSPIIIIPAAHICFFSGGTAAIFGNSTGGWRGAIAGSFVVGLLLAFLPLILVPVFQQMGINSSTFPNIDYNIVGSLLHGILQLVH
ncbi:PTS ascorbate transporter subunit IIC [Lactobacillus panisapium]|uniref:Ascorbate-specific PTS system EIIC component n=1 Tax=Lactobacillus panisapium TaxID=2012495 RepID=A0ABX8W645_9LACO|nr:PTS ascorbate transporter subunit IIC [Lactobacillus panisapium]QYN52137.1 PTS transporter subunit IIC [Lactobacillus panisapium]